LEVLAKTLKIVSDVFVAYASIPVLKCQLFTDRGSHGLPQCLKQFSVFWLVFLRIRHVKVYLGLRQLSQLDMQKLCNNNTHTE